MNFTFALEQFELFVLILIRLASFVFAAPFFNMANVPRKVKAGFALCLTVLVYSLFPDMTVEYNGMIDYAIIVVEEMIVGILLGAVTSFACRLLCLQVRLLIWILVYLWHSFTILQQECRLVSWEISITI